MKRLILSTLLIWLIQSGFAGENTLHGLFFGDYYWMAQHHNNELENKNGFWIRRVFVTFDRSINDNWDARIRFEMNSAGDFSSPDKLTPYIKDAYFRYQWNDTKIRLGISPTPSWYQVSKLWGYRHIERTPALLQKMYGSRDLGIAIQGSMLSNQILYHVMLGNGSGLGSETNKGKQFNASLALPLKAFIVQLSGYYESLPDKQRRSLIQGLFGYHNENHRVGVLYARQQHKTTMDKRPLSILSFFGSKRFTNRLGLFARWDHTFDSNPKGDQITFFPLYPKAAADIFIAGLDIRVEKEIHILPNIEAVTYAENDQNTQPRSDLLLRLTFYAKL
ncbi:hypothetical protein GF407_05400 [candidate division KSB1 bacterium]|nr:hypothetical protein [candidate division KSB1 bacterium]